MVHTLRREQFIPRPIGEVFEFFSDARNLETITPAWLRFEIVTPPPIRMAQGTLLEYRLKWHGFPVRWTTRIVEWNPPYSFADIQLRGPYKLWRHVHNFEAEGGGTRMADTVSYRLPFGIVGLIAHALKVRRDLENVFDYRCRQIATKFGGDAACR